MTVPGVRQISVPRHEIIAVSLLDIPILKDCSLGNSIMDDRRHVHVLDFVVVLVRPRSFFDSSNKDILESSGIPVSLDGIKQSSKVLVKLDVESSIPLPGVS